MRRWAAACRVATLALALTAAACGDDDGGGETAESQSGGGAQTTTTHSRGGGMAGHTDHVGNPTSDCSPSGTNVTITASNTSFDKNCLAAPASQSFTITYDNKDSAAHNLAILESHTAADVLFRADIFQGPKVQTFNVGALRPGVYAFHCEVHPARMSGTFVVK
jgi:plastocyanin